MCLSRALASLLALASFSFVLPARAEPPEHGATAPEVRPPPVPPTKPVEEAPEKAAPGAIDYVTRRYEPAGFPLIGGSSDIGFEFGGVGTLTRFGDGTRPYVWNMDLVLAASVKNAGSGLELVQQNYLWQWDIPGLEGGRLRLNPAVSFTRTVNQGYFGLGNASSGDRPATATGDVAGRYFQYVATEGRVRHLTRYKLKDPFDLMIAGVYRYESPETYAGSKLEDDATKGLADGTPLRGLQKLSLLEAGGGIVYDTRDNEFFPHTGAFHQIGVKYIQGLPVDSDIRYGEASANLATYFTLAKNVVLAGRVVGDLQFGNVPFYDLYTAGPFIRQEMPGGSSGVRGVPIGRYLGLVKIVGNAEVRALPVGFHLLGQEFHLGAAAFFDAGRVWSDYTFSSPLDGKGLGIKWGTGLGGLLQWGQAAVFRMEIAYSPDAESENPGFPFGIYVEDGVMF